MTTQDIQQFIDSAIRGKFKNITSESGEMMTSEEGDGRFFGKVLAIRYGGFSSGGLGAGRDLFLAIGETEKKVQIIKFGKSEVLKPSKTDLEMLLLKELGIKIESFEKE